MSSLRARFAIGSHQTSRKLSAMRAPRLRANSPHNLLMKMLPLGGQMELLRGVSAANNFVLALVPLLSSRLFSNRSRPGGGGVSNAARMQKTDHRHRRLLRARRERPRRRAADQGYELAPM